MVAFVSTVIISVRENYSNRVVTVVTAGTVSYDILRHYIMISYYLRVSASFHGVIFPFPVLCATTYVVQAVWNVVISK